MAYTPQTIITTNENSPIDSFARLRFSTPTTLFDSKQLFDNLPLFYDDAEISGSGTGSSHNPNRASTVMTVSNSTAGRRIRQTFQAWNYQPGKSQLIIVTFAFGQNGAGVQKKVGYFDDDNGVFLHMNGINPEFVIRSGATGSTVDNTITQSNWNADKLDGTGASGITINWEKAQIFFVDFEWLGVGSVRFGFFIDGLPVIAHREYHANIVDFVYMSTPSLPIRYEIENTGLGNALSLEHICSTVISEGGFEPLGVVRSADRGASKMTSSNNDVRALISIRLKATHKGANVFPINFSILAGVYGGIDSRWLLMFNPSVGGTDQASWTSVSNSSVEYDISRDATNPLSGGTVITSGYFNDLNPLAAFTSDTTLRLGFSILGVPDEIVLAVGKVDGGGTEEYFGGITWRELL